MPVFRGFMEDSLSRYELNYYEYILLIWIDS